MAIILSLTNTDIIGSVAAFAALVTAIITLRTVIEIKKQREHSYHPDINVSNIEFFVYRYSKEEDEDFESENLFYSKNKINENEPRTGFNELTIEINNIGLAVAKEVVWYWEFDLYESHRTLKSNDPSFLQWRIEEDFLLIKSEKLGIDWIYSIDEEIAGGYFNFILPYSVENRKNEIRIPQYFLDQYWIYKCKSILYEDKTNQEEYPPLRLYIEYKNMHGKPLQKKLLLNMRYSFISSPNNPSYELAKFRILIVEED